MDTDQIEPVLLLCTWLKELDFSSFEGLVQPLIPHVAYTIESKLRVSLLQKYGLDLKVICLLSPSVVIE